MEVFSQSDVSGNFKKIVMKSISLFLIFFILFGCDKSQTNNGQDFIGIWESNDELKIKLEIKEQYREGKKVEDRYELKIIKGKSKLPKYYIQEGQYNYQLVTADPQYNFHPFMEFIHKNSFGDTIPYLGLDKENNVLKRRYRTKEIPEIEFNRVK